MTTTPDSHSKCTHDVGARILAGQSGCPLCLAADLATAERLLRRAVTEISRLRAVVDAARKDTKNRHSHEALGANGKPYFPLEHCDDPVCIAVRALDAALAHEAS